MDLPPLLALYKKAKDMNSAQILQSDILDIIFDGKNKLYGAYQLRKTYNNRIAGSLAMMGILVFVAILIRAVSGTEKKTTAPGWIEVGETAFTDYKENEELKVKVRLPELKRPADVATVRFTDIRIAKSNEVVSPPPDVQQLKSARIGFETRRGVADDYINAPPEVPGGTKVIAGGTNEKKDNSDVVVINVDIQASFPGGVTAWTKYVQKAIEKELDDFTDADFGTCIVKFIVDKEGKVSQVHATTMQGTRLAEVSVNAIRKGPRWIPAQQNGHYVNAYRTQPVTLRRPGQ